MDAHHFVLDFCAQHQRALGRPSTSEIRTVHSHSIHIEARQLLRENFADMLVIPFEVTNANARPHFKVHEAFEQGLKVSLQRPSENVALVGHQVLPLLILVCHHDGQHACGDGWVTRIKRCHLQIRVVVVELPEDR